MDAAFDTSHKPPEGFAEDKRVPIVEIELTDSTELWLIQWPVNQSPDFDGQAALLSLGGDGRIGTFEESSGKSYEMVSCKYNGPVANVFLTSSTEAKIAGKISRHVSLIHYLEPSEVQKHHMGHSQRSPGPTLTVSGWQHPTPTRSIKPTKTRISGHSTPSGRSKSSPGESSKIQKRKRASEPGNSVEKSGKGNSDVTSTGPVEKSQVMKARKE